MGLERGGGGCTSGGWGISVSYLELMYKMKWVITTSDWRAVLAVSHPLTISSAAAITRLLGSESRDRKHSVRCWMLDGDYLSSRVRTRLYQLAAVRGLHISTLAMAIGLLPSRVHRF